MVLFDARTDVVNNLPGSCVRGIDPLQFHETLFDVPCYVDS